MKTYTKTSITEEPRLVISYDQDPMSPREDTNLGYFITVDSNYHSPDKHEDLERIVKETGDIATSLEDHIKLMKSDIKVQTEEEVIAIYPITKYEHGGVAYSLGEKHGFDNSNNGFYIITKNSQKETGVEEKNFEEAIEQELGAYNKYANGEVYGFILYKEDGEIEDSCWGFYDINDIKECLPEEFKGEDLEEYFQN